MRGLAWIASPVPRAGLMVAGVLLAASALAQAPFPAPFATPGATLQGPGLTSPEISSQALGDGVVDPTRKRDPFWPVGYAPKVVRKAVNTRGASPVATVIAPEPPRTPQWDEARKKLDVRGVSIIGREKGSGKPRYVAMVAGKLVEAGDVVTVTHEELVYRWKVMAISTEGISFQKMNAKPE